ncbi:MAG: RluA family pseudouridine synthase [Myxococcota bacterium]
MTEAKEGLPQTAADGGGQRFEVPREDAGRRLDAWLAERLSLSRAAVRRLLARGAVRIGGTPQTGSAKGLALRAGEQVEVDDAPRPEDERAAPEPGAPLTVLAEGPGWLAVDKPAGVPVHPLSPEEGGCVLNAVAARHPEIHGVGEGALRSGVVHRLDVDTSGALLLATEETRWQVLRQAFREHRVEKRYRAIVRGPLATDGERRLPLVVARHQPAFVRVARPKEQENARETTTRWRVLERFAEASLLEVETTSGFLHQVRAVLAHEGHPLAGDRTYAETREAPDPTTATRHLLHAASLCVDDVAAESPDPPDFAVVLADLRARG